MIDNTASAYWGHVPPASTEPHSSQLAAQPARHDGALSYEDLAYQLDAIDTTQLVSTVTSATPVTVEAVIDGRVYQLAVRRVGLYDATGTPQVTITAS